MSFIGKSPGAQSRMKVFIYEENYFSQSKKILDNPLLKPLGDYN